MAGMFDFAYVGALLCKRIRSSVTSVAEMEGHSRYLELWQGIDASESD